MDAAQPERQALRDRHPVLWYGILYGVIAGIVVAAAGAGKVIQGDEALAVAGAHATSGTPSPRGRGGRG